MFLALSSPPCYLVSVAAHLYWTRGWMQTETDNISYLWTPGQNQSQHWLERGQHRRPGVSGRQEEDQGGHLHLKAKEIIFNAFLRSRMIIQAELVTSVFPMVPLGWVLCSVLCIWPEYLVSNVNLVAFSDFFFFIYSIWSLCFSSICSWRKAPSVCFGV